MPKIKITISNPDTGEVLDQFIVTNWRECDAEDEGVGTHASECLLIHRVKASLEMPEVVKSLTEIEQAIKRGAVVRASEGVN